MNNIFFWRNTIKQSFEWMSSWYIFIDIEKTFDSIHCRVKKKINFRLVSG